MTFSASFQISLHVDWVDASIDNKILKNPHIILFHFAALEKGRKQDIIIFTKDRGEFTESFK